MDGAWCVARDIEDEEKTTMETDSDEVEVVESIYSHKLRSMKQGDSPIERLAKRLERRYDNRIEIPFAVRKTLLLSCQEISDAKGYPDRNKISHSDLQDLYDKAKEKQERKSSSGPVATVRDAFGFYDDDALLLECYERACTIVSQVQLNNDDWFYFQDFSFYHTRVKSRWPWLRNTTRIAILTIICFYLATVLFFCHVVDDEDVCPRDPTGAERSYYGWLSALYFASATMSTVGFGDVTVSKDSRGRVFYGAVFMIVAMLVAINSFGAAFEASFGRVTKKLAKRWENIVEGFLGKEKPGELLYVKIRRIKMTILSEVILQFIVLNFIGVVVSRYFASKFLESDRWTWMDCFYWSVQASTTIGYGDMKVPFELRWFGVIYLTVATYSVGNTLGRLQNMTSRIQSMRKFYAWERREASKAMIYELRSSDNDKTVDQYEFAISSLLTLGKISSDDLVPIMDKFRALASPSGFIELDGDVEGNSSDENAAQDPQCSVDGECPVDC